MHHIFLLILLLSLTFCAENQNKFQSNECFPDKGIKSTITKIEPNADYGFREVIYNQEGMPLEVYNSHNRSENKWVYSNGKLLYIINTGKELPTFYKEEERESLLTNGKTTIDTSCILSHHDDGRLHEMKNADGTTVIYEYTNCESELRTTLDSTGDTLEQVLSTNKNSVLMEETWIIFYPKTSTTTKYSGYEFNQNGHWIKRSYTRQNGEVITENREVVYY